MKIVISDMHECFKRKDEHNYEEYYIGLLVDAREPIQASAHGRGSIFVGLGLGSVASGVYVTCIDDEGYPL